MTERICETCCWYDGDDVNGHCRLSPPVIGSMSETVWPHVTADDWCSHWQNKRRAPFVTKELGGGPREV